MKFEGLFARELKVFVGDLGAPCNGVKPKVFGFPRAPRAVNHALISKEDTHHLQNLPHWAAAAVPDQWRSDATTAAHVAGFEAAKWFFFKRKWVHPSLLGIYKCV